MVEISLIINHTDRERNLNQDRLNESIKIYIILALNISIKDNLGISHLQNKILDFRRF